jgi:transcriptional regulator of aromatic amino acid metabolism
MNRERLRKLSAALRRAAKQCDDALVVDDTYRNKTNPIDGIARFVAGLVEREQIDAALPEWFVELEKETLRELIRRGARTRQLMQYLGKKDDAVRQHLHRRGLTLGRCKKTTD